MPYLAAPGGAGQSPPVLDPTPRYRTACMPSARSPGPSAVLGPHQRPTLKKDAEAPNCYRPNSIIGSHLSPSSPEVNGSFAMHFRGFGAIVKGVPKSRTWLQLSVWTWQSHLAHRERRGTFPS